MGSKYKASKKKIKKYASVCCGLILIVMAIFNKLEVLNYDDLLVSLNLRDSNTSTAELSVHFIDVGQGDCSLIVDGDIAVLIDAGESENSSKIIAYLNSLDIKKLDYIIATHPHSDHIGGLSEIINTFPVGKIYMSRMPDELTPTTVVYENLLNAISDNGLKISTPKFGEKLDFGNAKLELYPPLEEFDGINNFSIVSRLTHSNNTFLFTGDAEKEVEKSLLNENIDLKSKVLKVGHHGSNTSSTTAFLEEVEPEICIVSCGYQNSYNHPSSAVIKRLNAYTGNIFRTDLLGTIVLNSDGKTLEYSY